MSVSQISGRLKLADENLNSRSHDVISQLIRERVQGPVLFDCAFRHEKREASLNENTVLVHPPRCYTFKVILCVRMRAQVQEYRDCHTMYLSVFRGLFQEGCFPEIPEISTRSVKIRFTLLLPLWRTTHSTSLEVNGEIYSVRTKSTTNLTISELRVNAYVSST
jgi:hypothetical protein